MNMEAPRQEKASARAERPSRKAGSLTAVAEALALDVRSVLSDLRASLRVSMTHAPRGTGSYLDALSALHGEVDEKTVIAYGLGEAEKATHKARARVGAAQKYAPIVRMEEQRRTLLERIQGEAIETFGDLADWKHTRTQTALEQLETTLGELENGDEGFFARRQGFLLSTEPSENGDKSTVRTHTLREFVHDLRDAHQTVTSALAEGVREIGKHTTDAFERLESVRPLLAQFARHLQALKDDAYYVLNRLHTERMSIARRRRSFDPHESLEEGRSGSFMAARMLRSTEQFAKDVLTVEEQFNRVVESLADASLIVAKYQNSAHQVGHARAVLMSLEKDIEAAKKEFAPGRAMRRRARELHPPRRRTESRIPKRKKAA